MSNLESKRLLVKPVNLEQLQEASRTAHRLWLPETFAASKEPASSFWFAFAAGALMLVSLVSIGQIFAALLLCLCLLLCWYYDHRKSLASAGWKLDFDAARLEPVGIKGQQPVQIDPLAHSLGCYLLHAKGTAVNFLLELRHAKKGPVAPICEFQFGLNNHGIDYYEALRLLDASVQSIAQRLGIPRSGAPLPLQK
jgi:hypothetical protein